jgi:hypothetical protein
MFSEQLINFFQIVYSFKLYTYIAQNLYIGISCVGIGIMYRVIEHNDQGIFPTESDNQMKSILGHTRQPTTVDYR